MRWGWLGVFSLLLGAVRGAEVPLRETFAAPDGGGWAGGPLLVRAGAEATELAAPAGERGEVWVERRISLGRPSPVALPWVWLELGEAPPAIFGGLSLRLADEPILRAAAPAGLYAIDLAAVLPSWIGQSEPVRLAVGLAGAAVEQPGPWTRLVSFALVDTPPPGPRLATGPEGTEARYPDGVVRRGEPVVLEGWTTPAELTLTRAGAPARAVPIALGPWPATAVGPALPPGRGAVSAPLARPTAPAGAALHEAMVPPAVAAWLPDGLVASPGELWLTARGGEGPPRHWPLPWDVDTRTDRREQGWQRVGRSPVQPTFDGTLGDRAWQDAVALPGIAPALRVLVLATDEGLALAIRAQPSRGAAAAGQAAGAPAAEAASGAEGGRAEGPGGLAGSGTTGAASRVEVSLRPAGEAGGQVTLALGGEGAWGQRLSGRAEAALVVRWVTPPPPLLGASDGGWSGELFLPWAGFGDLDATAFGLACEGIWPGEQVAVRWPGRGRRAWLAGLPDLARYRLPTGAPEVTVTGEGAAARLVVELPLENRTGAAVTGRAIGGLRRAAGLTFAEAPVALQAGESGRLHWEFPTGTGPAQLDWRLLAEGETTPRRVGSEPL